MDLFDRKDKLNLLEDTSIFDSSLSFLFSRIIHDLASPLNAINLGCESLECDDKNEMLGYIKDSASKTISLFSIFRFCLTKRETISSKFELEATLKSITQNISVVSNEELIPTWLCQLICSICIDIRNCFEQSKKTICNINTTGVNYLFFINFGNVNDVRLPTKEECTHRNIFFKIAEKYAERNGLKFWNEKDEKGNFFFVCAYL